MIIEKGLIIIVFESVNGTFIFVGNVFYGKKMCSTSVASLHISSD